jgi:hypothetical protein
MVRPVCGHGTRSMLKPRIVIVAWLAVLLGKQKRLDFKPKNDESALDRPNTEPCVLCCDFLRRVREAATSSLNGKNCEAFLSEVGVAFHRCAVAGSLDGRLPRPSAQSIARPPQEIPGQRDRQSFADQVRRSPCLCHGNAGRRCTGTSARTRT